MSKHSRYDYWLEAEAPFGQGPPAGGAPGMGDPGAMGMGAPTTAPGPQGQQPQMPQANQQGAMQPPQQDDVTQDPQQPMLPDDQGGDQDFETWRNEFFKLAVEGDTQKMIQSLKSVRDRDLDRTQEKFVEDNLQIQYFREDANVLKASETVRNAIKQQLDMNYPGAAMATYITQALTELPSLNEVFFKLTGFYGMKGDLHRKFIAALLGAVQVGGGGTKEDLVYCGKDFFVNISTRFSTEWGEVAMGKWSLQPSDPQKYLEEPELARLHDGSPEEKRVLRHRVVLDSISEKFRTRSYIMHVANKDGSLNVLGWDFGDSLTAGYVDGHLKVENKSGESADAMLDDDGQIVKIKPVEVKFVKKDGSHDMTGKVKKDEKDFLEQTNGMLYFKASLETIRAMSSALQGCSFQEVPYNGNPSDIKQLQRLIPTLSEMLMRKL